MGVEVCARNFSVRIYDITDAIVEKIDTDVFGGCAGNAQLCHCARSPGRTLSRAGCTPRSARGAPPRPALRHAGLHKKNAVQVIVFKTDEDGDKKASVQPRTILPKFL